MHYGDAVIRRMVPLALGLLSTSDAQLTIVDTLSRYASEPMLNRKSPGEGNESVGSAYSSVSVSASSNCLDGVN